MGKILCATRGGEASHRTQDAAIALAKAQGDELVFLYVADISFLNQTAAPLVVDVESRLAKMGQFQLTIAQERAREQGLEPQIAVRRGKLRAELVAAAKELGKSPYTVRQYCRHKRIRAEKQHCGRGRSKEWKISHQEIIRVKGEGLLPPPSIDRRTVDLGEE